MRLRFWAGVIAGLLVLPGIFGYVQASTTETSFTSGSTVTQDFGYNDEGSTLTPTQISIDYNNPDNWTTATMDITGEKNKATIVLDSLRDVESIGDVIEHDTSNVGQISTLNRGSIVIVEENLATSTRQDAAIYDPYDNSVKAFDAGSVQCSTDAQLGIGEGVGGITVSGDMEEGAGTDQLVCTYSGTEMVRWDLASGTLATWTVDGDSSSGTPPYAGDIGNLDPTDSDSDEVFVVEADDALIYDISDGPTGVAGQFDRTYKFAGPEHITPSSAWMFSFDTANGNFERLEDQTDGTVSEDAIDSAISGQQGGIGTVNNTRNMSFYAPSSTDIKAIDVDAAGITFQPISGGLDVAAIGGVADLDDINNDNLASDPMEERDFDGVNDHPDWENDVWYVDSNGNLKALLFNWYYPHGVTVDVGGNQFFSTSGFLTSLQNDQDFSTEIKNYVSNTDCTGGCKVDVNVFSNSPGTVKLSDLNVEYNDVPDSLSSVSFTNSTTAHEFDVSFTASDKDGATDPTGCSVDWQDEDGTTGTVTGSISDGGTDTPKCTATVSTSTNANIDVLEDITITSISMADNKGSVKKSVSATNPIPNQAPSKPTSQTDLSNRTKDNTPSVSWSGHSDPEVDDLYVETQIADLGQSFSDDFQQDTSDDGTSDSGSLCAGSPTSSSCSLQSGNDYKYRVRIKDFPDCDPDNNCNLTSSYTDADPFHINQPPVVESINTFETDMTSATKFNLSETVVTRANVSDLSEDAVQNGTIDQEHPNGTLVQKNTTLNVIDSGTGWSLTQVNYTIGGTDNDTNTYSQTVFVADDAVEWDAGSNTFSAVEQTKPKWKNTSANTTKIGRLDPIQFTGWGSDNIEVDFAALRTNDSGTFEVDDLFRYTDNLAADTFHRADIDYKNTSLQKCTTVGWNIRFNDTSDNTNTSDTLTFETDCTKPTFKNHNDLADNAFIDTSKNTFMTAEGNDTLGIGFAVLATNETGVFENKTGVYESPLHLGDVKDTFKLANFTWKNASRNTTTLGKRIWFNDSTGNWNVTDTDLLSVDPPPNITGTAVYNHDYTGQNRINVRQTIHVRANVTDVDGRTDIEEVRVNLTDPIQNLELERGNMTPIEHITVDGVEGKTYEFNFSMPMDSSDGGTWNATFKANDSKGNTDEDNRSFIYQVFSVTASTINPGGVDVGDPVPFSSTDSISNPSDVTYTNAKVIIEIPKDTNGPDNFHLLNPQGNVVQEDSLSPNAGEANFTISSADSSYDKSWTEKGNITPVQAFRLEKNVTEGGRNVVKQQVNITNNITTIDDVSVTARLSDPQEILSLELFQNGNEITDDTAFGPPTAAADHSHINWTDPTVEQLTNYTAEGDRGTPIRIEEDTIITNHPVVPGKRIQWRRCKRFSNFNAFDKNDFSHRFTPPLAAQEYRIETGCSSSVAGNPRGLSFGDTAFIAETFDISGDSNVTKGLWFTTESIATEGPNIERPEVSFVDEPDETTLNITVESQAPIDISTDNEIQVNAPIDFGLDTEVFENAESFRAIGRVENGHLFNFSNISQGESREFEFRYDVPVAESEVVLRGNTSEGFQRRVYRVRSQSPRTVDETRLWIPDIDCTEVVNATQKRLVEQKLVHVKELEVLCGRTERIQDNKLFGAQVDLNTLPEEAQADPIRVDITWQEKNIVQRLGGRVRMIFAEWLTTFALILLLVSLGWLAYDTYLRDQQR